VSYSRPHTPLLGPVPPPPATPTPLAKRRVRKELLRLHPHHHPIRSGPPSQLTWISRDKTCQLPLLHYTATPRRLPNNTPTPGRRKSSPRESTLPVPLGTGNLDPDWRPPTTMAPKATPTYAQAAAPPGKGKKGRQTKSPISASSVAVASGEVFTKSPPPLPHPVRRFFASRTTFEPHPEALKIAAHFQDITASVLREANCSLPLSFTCTVNDKGSVSLLGTDLHTPASAYTPYFAPLTSRLNKAFPIGNSPCDIFKPTPNETQLLIHSVPLAFLPSDDDQLFPSLHESIRNARGVSILSARYLNPDTEARGQNNATSVVVTVAPPDAYAILPSINLFSQNRRVEQMSPPLKTPSARDAGSSATSLPAVPAHYPSAPSARSPTPKRSIAALTLPALRVAISDLSSPAVHPRWHAVLTARKSTLRAAGIAPPARKPLPTHQRCYLDRRRMAWISLKTRLALRRSFRQHRVPLLTPRVPLYSHTMLLHLGREPIAPSPSPISPQERAVMNP